MDAVKYCIACVSCERLLFIQPYASDLNILDDIRRTVGDRNRRHNGNENRIDRYNFGGPLENDSLLVTVCHYCEWVRSSNYNLPCHVNVPRNPLHIRLTHPDLAPSLIQSWSINQRLQYLEVRAGLDPGRTQAR